jgi:signal peptidase II
MRIAARSAALLMVAFVTIGCDQVTKHAATVLLEGEPDRSYVADTLRVGYAENAGGFLSLGADLSPAVRAAVFTVVTGFLLLALLAVGVRQGYAGLSAVGLVLFVAGGLSNWIDRVLHGRVIDFLNVGIGAVRTGVFNVADMAIMLGAVLLAMDAIRGPAPARSSDA